MSRPPRRKANAMSLHFRVRSVLLHSQGSAVTLQPVKWGRWVHKNGRLIDPSDDSTDFTDDEVEYAECEPHHKWAEPEDDRNGKLTELRFDTQVSWRPDDYLTLPDPLVYVWADVIHGIVADEMTHRELAR